MKRDKNYTNEYLFKREKKLGAKKVEKDNREKFRNINSVRLDKATGEKTDSHK